METILLMTLMAKASYCHFGPEVIALFLPLKEALIDGLSERVRARCRQTDIRITPYGVS